MDRLEQMKLGGRRRDPTLPHVFVEQTTDIDGSGGAAHLSRACGECGMPPGPPLHVEPDDHRSPRERHGRFGE